jgi:hydrogenase expression/formation protein HypC
MCIGIPMCVVSVTPGHALCEGRGGRRSINTALIGETAPGDWLLVFLESARERISAERAAEVDAALDMMLRAMNGTLADATPTFELPSSMNARQVAALAGVDVPSP